MALTTNISTLFTGDSLGFFADSPVVISLHEDTNYIEGYELTLSTYYGTHTSKTDIKTYSLTAPNGSLYSQQFNINIAPYLSSRLDYDNRAVLFSFSIKIYYNSTNTTIASGNNIALFSSYRLNTSTIEEQLKVFDINSLPDELGVNMKALFSLYNSELSGFTNTDVRLEVYQVENGVENLRLTYSQDALITTSEVFKDVVIEMYDTGFLRLKLVDGSTLLQQKDITPICASIEQPFTLEYLNRYGLLSSFLMYGKRSESLDIAKEYFRNTKQTDYVTHESFEKPRQILFNRKSTKKWVMNTGWLNEEQYENLQQLLLSEFVRFNHNFTTDFTYSFSLNFEARVAIDSGTYEENSCSNDGLDNLGLESYKALEITETGDPIIYLKPLTSSIQKKYSKDGLINYTIEFEEDTQYNNNLM